MGIPYLRGADRVYKMQQTQRCDAAKQTFYSIQFVKLHIVRAHIYITYIYSLTCDALFVVVVVVVVVFVLLLL